METRNHHPKGGEKMPKKGKRSKKSKPAKARMKMKRLVKKGKKAMPKAKKSLFKKLSAKKGNRAKGKPTSPKKGIAAALKKIVQKPSANEREIGIVSHYYTHIMVAVVELNAGSVKVGDTIHIKGATSDFRQKVGSMQVDRTPVNTASKGQAIGLKVDQHAREHDKVYLC